MKGMLEERNLAEIRVVGKVTMRTDMVVALMVGLVRVVVVVV